MKKKILALILSVAMVLSFLPFSVFAADDATAAYVKVTEAPADWSGDYLIVYEKSSTEATVFNGGLTTLDAEANHFAATIADGKIEANATTNAAKFTIAKSGTNYTIKSASGYYIGQTADGNKVLSSTSTAYTNTLSLESSGVKITASGKCVLRFNASTTSGNNRFRYYKSSTYTQQKAIQLYKYTELGEPDPDACQHENYTVDGYVAPEALKAGFTGAKICGDCGETFDNGTVIPMLEYEADSTITIPQANELAAALGGAYSTNKYYIEGTVTEVKNATYGNVYIEDAEGNSFYVYGLYKNGVRYDKMDPQPLVTDIIKVYANVGSYNGTPQMRDAELVEHTVVAEPDVVEEPEDGSTLTIPEANQLGTDLNGKTSTGKFYVVGEITEVYQDYYGNMYIKDAEGNTLTVYGTYNADGSLKYGEMENAPIAGDTVKVYGAIGSYNGKAQMVNALIVEQTECAHANTTLTGVIDAACGVAGYTGDYVCDLCDRVAEQGTPTEPLAHDQDTLIPGYKAECGKAGLTDGYACSKCKEVQVPQKEIEALEHDMQAGEPVAPTEFESGYTVYTCANGCSESYKADFVMPLSSEVQNVKAEQITETMDLRVTWDEIDGADMYLVYVYDAEGVQVRGATLGEGRTSVRINGFKVGNYTVKVRARVGGKYSMNDKAVELAFGSILPAAPIVTVVETTKDSITVTWEAIEGAQKYFVQFVGGDQRFAPATTDTTLTFTGLKVNTEYKISVCVKLSDTVYVGYGEQTTATTKAHADIEITATKTDDVITVAWDVTNDNDTADKYWVKRVDAEGNVTQIAVTDATAIEAQDIEGANTFYIIARVYDKNGIARYVTSAKAEAQ